jgi:hypothetical protein
VLGGGAKTLKRSVENYSRKPRDLTLNRINDRLKRVNLFFLRDEEEVRCHCHC